MRREYSLLYRESRAEARRQGETQLHEDSFRQNVDCARAIEKAIRDYADEDDPKGFLFEGCAQSVLEEYGFQRVEFVLANSLQYAGCQYLHSGEALQWAKGHPVPQDGKYNQQSFRTADSFLVNLATSDCTPAGDCISTMFKSEKIFCFNSSSQPSKIGIVLLSSIHAKSSCCFSQLDSKKVLL